jgi:hypothetical protein
MDSALWRVRLRFASMGDETHFLGWWEETTHASSYADTPAGDGPLTFFYFAERAPADTLAAALRPELRRLPIDPVDVGVDHWRSDEARWSDESETSADDDDDELRAAREESRWGSREWAAKDASRERAERDGDPELPSGSNWFEAVVDALIRSPLP